MRRYSHAPERIIEAIHDLDKFGIEAIALDRALLLLVLDRMWNLGLSSYDATYFALAESMNASLVTLDVRLATAAGSRALPRRPHHLAETRIEYAGTEAGGVWAQFGGYLAELRRDPPPNRSRYCARR